MAERGRILIVEDEAAIALTLEDMVIELGFQVSGIAGNLASATRQIESGGYDAVLLDVNLKGQSSLPVGRALFEKAVPFAFVTGYGASAIEGLGPCPVIQKPFTQAQIAAVLDYLLPAPTHL